MAAALARARELAGTTPVAANLLVPFATRAHVDALQRATVPLVVLHAGFDRQLVSQLRNNGSMVLQTVGTPEEARRALDHGVDGLVVQGREAGGHLVGVEPALNAFARVRDEAKPAATKPLLLAGGIADAADVKQALDAGAAAAVAGTRFLLTEEAAAHAEYKRRVMNAERTVETQLFGFGWPMRHRVVPNAATERWCRSDDLGPRLLRTAYRLSVPLARLPLSVTNDLVHLQRAALPLFGPNAMLEGMPDRLADATALYAGETARRLDSVVPAATAVTLLTGTTPAPSTQSPTIRSS
jgi:NAD(P)H-dependent flavin oxidoreductase YrpB (nitropropane dioxygenase family)